MFSKDQVAKLSRLAGERQMVAKKEILSRVASSFKGLSSGDAIGKQTETLSRENILQWYPEGVKGFHGRIGDVIPRYVDSSYKWRIGKTTDDTEQTIAIAKAIIREGRVSHSTVGKELLLCKKSNHPTLALWRFQQYGEPDHICFEGNGCGAAMRSTPVGVSYSCDELELLVAGAFEASIPTHGGQIAICAASAVAAAISAAIDGYSSKEVLRVAIEAAKEAEKFRPAPSDENIAEAVRQIYYDLFTQDELSIDYLVQRYFPDKTATIVPLAIALSLVTESVEETILLAANLGGDTDTVASIGGAIAGAMFPDTINENWYRAVVEVNGNELLDLVESLVSTRC